MKICLKHLFVRTLSDWEIIINLIDFDKKLRLTHFYFNNYFELTEYYYFYSLLYIFSKSENFLPLFINYFEPSLYSLLELKFVRAPSFYHLPLSIFLFSEISDFSDFSKKIFSLSIFFSFKY
jgi:hypothetical protein